MKTSDKLGYLLVIVGFIVYCSTHMVLSLYETDYLVFGEKGTVIIKNIEYNNGDFVYWCKEKEGNNILYTSLPTDKSYSIGQEINVLIVPHFKKVILGRFILPLYIFSWVVFFFLLSVSVISLLKIKGLESVQFFGKNIDLTKFGQGL
ncbi:hypothetical protein [Persicobacter diffluens]|uniref:DUF3592 domain-containing protein n=1 Tax=Persicobacter diffluens TaxID=981 RepID=A0AAN4W5G8_9BACT|nr:hypothetical protein PEDI_55780 [Persicobacter diffluens]